MKRALLLILIGIGGAASLFGCAAWVMRGSRHEGPVSDHFDGERFFNEVAVDHGLGAFVRWRLTRRPDVWPDWIDSEPGPPPPSRVDGDGLRVTLVNHATVLVQTAGVNVLTDPIWSERCSPVQWAGPRRHRVPGIRFEDLPPIDAVVVSHNHYDHLDLDTLARLQAAHAPRFLVGLGSAGLLARAGIDDAIELDWWEGHELRPGFTIHAVPARHFSSRGLFDRNRTLWCGFVLAAPGGSVYFAGDSGLGPHFEAIRDRLGPPRLALLPIGAFLPSWFMQPVHLSPEEALEVHERLGAASSVAVHFGTFPLGDDGPRRAADGLRELLADRSDRRPFLILPEGQGRDF
jgi:L-ascorbate metabolism protein UlaG (beta-lactamase superfamily)